MRTNIVINDEIMSKALQISNLKTKKEVVERALLDFISSQSRMNLLDLQGQIKFADDYDYKALREGV
jgi:Arc/MetJ family transcription regulator